LKNKIKSLKKDVKRLDDDDFDLQNQIDELEETAYGFIDLDNRDEEDLAYADEIAEKVELECECECKCGCHEDSDTVIDILKKKVKNLKEDVKRLDDDDFDMQNQIDSLEVVTYGYVALDDRDEEDKEYAKEILEKIELACGECCEEECSDEMSEEIIDEEEKTNYSCGCSNQVEIDEPTEKKEEENDTPWYKNE
jgi:chaperonin cofactor prefoldin